MFLTGSERVPWRQCEPAIVAHSSGLVEGVSARTYTPLMKRDVCQALEERVQHYVRRGRITAPPDGRNCRKSQDEERGACESNPRSSPEDEALIQGESKEPPEPNAKRSRPEHEALSGHVC